MAGGRIWDGYAGTWDAILGAVVRLLGSRRLRVRTGTLAVCVLAFVAGSVSGGAQNARPAVDLAPPFAVGDRTETSSLLIPCREVPNRPGDAAPSDPATGHVHIEMAAEAQECNSLAHDVSEVWNLGRPPDSLVGHPARVTVVFAPEAIDSDGVGGATLGGGVFLSIAGSQEWALGLFECSAGTCHPESPPVQDGRVVLDGTVEMLPAHVEAEYRAEAFVKGGTGRASVSLSGRLESVTFGAVDGGQNGP